MPKTQAIPGTAAVALSRFCENIPNPSETTGQANFWGLITQNKATLREGNRPNILLYKGLWRFHYAWTPGRFFGADLTEMPAVQTV